VAETVFSHYVTLGQGEENEEKTRANVSFVLGPKKIRHNDLNR
jgi:hypothetical protein